MVPKVFRGVGEVEYCYTETIRILQIILQRWYCGYNSWNQSKAAHFVFVFPLRHNNSRTAMDLYDKLSEAFGVVEQYLEYQHCFMSFGFWFFFFRILWIPETFMTSASVGPRNQAEKILKAMLFSLIHSRPNITLKQQCQQGLAEKWT